MALFAVILFFNYQDLLGIRETLRQTPLGLAISFSCHVPKMVLMALAWRRLLPMALRPALSTMLVLRWIRESLNALIPAGAIIGQAVAAQRLIRAGVAADLAAATATVDMTIEGATQALFTLAGLLLLLAAHRDLRLAQIVVIGISVAAAATAAMVVVQRACGEQSPAVAGEGACDDPMQRSIGFAPARVAAETPAVERGT
jgi:hypothetical protein